MLNRVEIIRKYEKWVTWWGSEPDRGQCHAINKGFARCSGTIINWLCGDDILLPDALAGVAGMYAENPSSIAWVGCCRRVTPEGKLVIVFEPTCVTRDGIVDWHDSGYISQPACFFSREASVKIGPVDETLTYALDVDYWIRLLALGPFATTSETWAQETWQPHSKTMSHLGESQAELHLLQIRHGYEKLALKRMAEQFNAYNKLRYGSFFERFLSQANLRLRPLIERFRRRGE